MGLWEQLSGLFSSKPRWQEGLVRRDWKFVDDSEWVERLREADEAMVAVYADWLEERGDGRAELLQRAARSDNLQAFVEANASALLGPLQARSRRGSRPELELEFRRGVLRGAAVRTRDVWADLEVLFGLPLARHLVDLGIGLGDGDGWDDQLSCLGRAPRLKQLLLGDFLYPEESMMSGMALGDASALWTLQPQLEVVTIRGLGTDLGHIDAPRLRRFSRETSALPRGELESILDARWPALQHLEVWFGAEAHGSGCEVSDVLPLLETSLPSLRTLALRNAVFVDELIEPLARSPLVRQLSTLDLSLGCLSDAGAELLLRNRERLAHLEELNLSESQLSPRHLEALTTVCKSVVLADQRDEPEEPGARFVAVGE